MTRLETSARMWGIGLSKAASTSLESIAGPALELIRFSSSHAPDPAAYSADAPCIIWMAWSAWQKMTQEQQAFFRRLESAPKVLLLNKDVPLSEVEGLLALGHFSTMRLPLTPSLVRETLERAEEVSHLYTDIYRMTQEIYLERELLARKNEQLSFINQFISRASQSLDPAEVLEGARQDLKRLFPVDLLQAIFWNSPQALESSAESSAMLFLATDKAGEAQHAWIQLLLESAAKVTQTTLTNYQIISMAKSDYERHIPPAPPAAEHVLMLPVQTGGVQFGCLALHAPSAMRLGRDQVELLHTAVNHLSLALKNALLFNQARSEAEYDGLTMIHNRKYFDRRLREELHRHQRYRQDLTVLLLDVDHFKDVNDTYGHQAGDLVLSELGALLADTVRNTDHPARYGGEEFAILLPQTDGAQAWILAERLRKRIKAMTFNHEGTRFHITASLGIASCAPGCTATPEALLREADQALYFAKQNGRNRVHWDTPAMDTDVQAMVQ